MGNTQDKILQRYATWLKLKRQNNDCTIRTAINQTSLFLRWLERNNIKIEDINQTVVDEYLLYCSNKYSRNSMVPVTINLRKFMEFLEKDIEVKVQRTTSPQRNKEALTREEIKRMLEAVKDNPLEYAIISTLYYSGMRASELRNLDIDDVDFDRLQIIIRHGKGGRYRIVNITKDCAMAIQRYLEVRQKPKEGHEKALFISPVGQRISTYYLWHLMKRTAAKAGIRKNVYVHLMRVTLITHLSEAGLSPREIQAQSGHRDIGTLMGYIQHTTERIRRAYEKAFESERIEIPSYHNERHDITPKISNEYYKRIAIEKYLRGEIDAETLHHILGTLEEKNTNKRRTIDPSYL